MTDAIELVIEPRERDLGGFSVRRILPYARRRMVGPFIFFDHLGPAVFSAGGGIDVRPHPHIGLETVTYLFDGEIMHRDSLGVVQPIRPGDVNWMTAGRGIVHSERTPPALRAAGPSVHAIQSWVALPREAEEMAPAFHHYPAAELPELTRPGRTIRLIAGAAFGARSPVVVQSSLFYAAVTLAAGAAVDLPLDHEERAVYVVEGTVTVAGTEIGPANLALLRPGRAVEVGARTAARLMLLGGAPLGEPRHVWWNFVSSDPTRIEQAKADWASGRFPAVPGESERIPLPEG